MESFLEKVTGHIFEKYSESFETLCVVTPNRRAGLFLRKHFSRKIDKPTWSPSFMSIEDFANKISELEVVDNLNLVFHFWEVYKQEEGESATSMEEFLQWAPMLLRDFDEIDGALDDPSQLFSYLNDLKYIATWNPDGTPLTEFQKKYLAFFEKLRTWHESFKHHLAKNNIAYQGMSFRKAARQIQQGAEIIWFEKVVFAGFNALNNAEEAIIDSLKKRGAAEVIFDSDPYYEQNPSHEAGLFVRKYKRKWSVPNDTQAQSLFSTPKNINVLGVPGNFNQAQLAGNLLEQNEEITKNERTAIVLANENLLVPVLNALPKGVEAINVTMGYPFARTNLFSFFESLMQLFITRHRMNQGGQRSSTGFYYKDLIRLLSNSCADFLDAGNGKNNQAELLVSSITKSNRTFYTLEQLAKLEVKECELSKIFSFLSENWDQNPQMVIPGLMEICKRLDNGYRHQASESGLKIQQTPFFVDFEALYYFSNLLKRVNLVVSKNSLSGLSVETLWQIIRQTCKETRIALSGEPVEGLQLMGVLETRNLDFENVVLLSVNENTLPKSKHSSSFIPFEVRRKFGLQVHTEKDAVYAYHFYRLLQRAKNVFLIYNTESGNMGSNEQSRFITQMQHELPVFNPQIDILSSIVSLAPNLKTEPKTILIEKTPEIETRLAQIAERGFSPSSLNTFIRCPLKFYLEKVAGISEIVEVEENLEASTIGSIVHGVLEDLFSPYKGKIISANDIDLMIKALPQATVSRFDTDYPGGDITTGKNLLLFELSKRQLQRFFVKEKQVVEQNMAQNKYLTILETEKKLEAILPVEIQGKKYNIKIAGTADRIDMVGGVTRIIDYKTGKVEARDLVVKNSDELTLNPKYDKAFQLLAYNWLYSNENPSCTAIQPEIFSLRNNKETLTVKVITPEGEEISNHSELFENKLKELVVGILNPELPFTQTDDIDHCRYCPFQALCGRFVDNAGF
jgi:ATP-dependent helicase/nuclease subunit B